MATTPTVVLVASSPENYTACGLTALGVAHQRLSPQAFRDFLTLDADVLIGGFDESRQTLAQRRDELAVFLRAGRIFLGFRGSEDESWLPAAAARDKAYELGEILRPEHRVFNRPHPAIERKRRRQPVTGAAAQSGRQSRQDGAFPSGTWERGERSFSGKPKATESARPCHAIAFGLPLNDVTHGTRMRRTETLTRKG